MFGIVSKNSRVIKRRVWSTSYGIPRRCTVIAIPHGTSLLRCFYSNVTYLRTQLHSTTAKWF